MRSSRYSSHIIEVHFDWPPRENGATPLAVEDVDQLHHVIPGRRQLRTRLVKQRLVVVHDDRLRRLRPPLFLALAGCATTTGVTGGVAPPALLPTKLLLMVQFQYDLEKAKKRHGTSPSSMLVLPLPPPPPLPLSRNLFERIIANSLRGGRSRVGHDAPCVSAQKRTAFMTASRFGFSRTHSASTAILSAGWCIHPCPWQA